MPSETSTVETRKVAKPGAPPPEQEHLPCPRCDSTNTKFCYYNNYNFSQPRHFCKSCRRYWTHGGTLRDIPVGGGTRKNAKRSRTSATAAMLGPIATTSGDHFPLSATPVLVPLTASQGGAVQFGGGGEGKSGGCGGGGGGVCGSFTSLLNTQGPGFLALGGFGLGIGPGFVEDVGFGLGRGVWPFSSVGDGGANMVAVGGTGGGVGVGVGGAATGLGNTWQFESGENGFVGARGVGVNYGTVANNLPPPSQVVGLCKSKNIARIRIFNPNPDILHALQNSGIQVILGVVNNDLPTIASSATFAATWVQTNVVPYAATVKFRSISVGNELVPGNLAASILPAMEALQRALIAANLHIPVSTTVAQGVVNPSYPPSAGAWSSDAASYMIPIVQFLKANKYPLLYNVYPYFSYRADPRSIRLDYALFNTTEVVVRDGSLGYTNLFDASVDALYWALEKAGAGDVEVVVSETGWPSVGGAKEPMANVINAETYNNNLVARMKANVGTPKRPGRGLETYIFALFNENLKAAGSEQHFGLFFPNMGPVYPVNW